MSEAATVQRAEALMAEGKVLDAVALTESLATGPAASHLALACHSGALKLAGRREEALAFDRQAIDRFAASPIAWYNYAATLDDLGRADEAVAAVEKAFSLGLDAPQAFFLYARALRAAGNHPRADYAYKQSLIRSPAAVEMAREYADYVWMLTGDVAAADSLLDQAFHAGGAATPLLVAKASLYHAAGQPERAASLLEAASQRMPGEIAIAMAAIDFALRLDQVDAAERYLRLAEAVDPTAHIVIQHSAIIDLARARPVEALAKLRVALESHPDDQSLWGWAATAARAADDPLYGELCDYGQMVRAYDLSTPDGWPTLTAFLGDLAKALKHLHPYQQHPTSQSLRHGSQTMHLLSGSPDPALRAFFQAIDAPIRQHMALLGEGPGPLRSRNTGRYRIEGAWSVRLWRDGFHRDHFHPDGWLSSAFYVETPDAALDSPGEQGWIRFGQPPFITDPLLPPDHFIRPKPGRLVLFPSYMWHGTVPFTTNETRMTIAFDAVPD